jgi:hypothetical protein
VVAVSRTAFDRLDEAGRHELMRRDVDRNGQVDAELALPALLFGPGLVEDPLSDLGDQAGLLGDGHQDRRGDEAVGGVGPTQEGFDADHPAAGGVHDGLVDEIQLASPRNPEQVLGQAPLVVAEVLIAQVKNPPGALAPAFRLVHGDVGVMEDLAGPAAFATGEGDTDTGRQG